MSRTHRPVITIAGAIDPSVIDMLERQAALIFANGTSEEGVAEAAKTADGILFRLKPRCTKALMASCPRLRVVGRHGSGLDMIDIRAATRLGIAVVHAPGSNAQAVAEHTLMLMLACVKNARAVDRMTREGDWSARMAPRNTELAGSTLGILGVGNCGRLVAKFANAIGMRVLGYDKYLAAEEIRRRFAEPVDSLDTLLISSDILSCHVPLTDETRGLLDAAALARLKSGAIFINTARGGIQDEAALANALTNGHLSAAGIDVFAEEPSPADNPLFRLENVIVSSHVAGITREAHCKTGEIVAREMLDVLNGRRPKSLVNPEVWPVVESSIRSG